MEGGVEVRSVILLGDQTDPFTLKPWCTQQMVTGRNDRLIKAKVEKVVFLKKSNNKSYEGPVEQTSFTLSEELSPIHVEGSSDFSSELCVPRHVWAGIYFLG